MKLAILATGGIDSTVLIYKAVKDGFKPTIITVDYGQQTRKIERKLLNYHIKKLGLDKLVILKIKYADWQCKPGLFKKGFKPKKVDTINDISHNEFFIEGRNAIMVLNAIAYCSTNKIDELQTGYYYDSFDWVHTREFKLITSDVSPHFVDALNLLTITGFTYHVRIRCPYFENRFQRDEIIALGKELGIDLINKTYSCYFNPKCKTCNNCIERKRNLGEY
jgi:7-cyano-7-deazaguanine synthase in queuosine biosynthesis